MPEPKKEKSDGRQRLQKGGAPLGMWSGSAGGLRRHKEHIFSVTEEKKGGMLINFIYYLPRKVSKKKKSCFGNAALLIFTRNNCIVSTVAQSAL